MAKAKWPQFCRYTNPSGVAPRVARLAIVMSPGEIPNRYHLAVFRLPRQEVGEIGMVAVDTVMNVPESPQDDALEAYFELDGNQLPAPSAGATMPTEALPLSSIFREVFKSPEGASVKQIFESRESWDDASKEVFDSIDTVSAALNHLIGAGAVIYKPPSEPGQPGLYFARGNENEVAK